MGNKTVAVHNFALRQVIGDYPPLKNVTYVTNSWVSNFLFISEFFFLEPLGVSESFFSTFLGRDERFVNYISKASTGFEVTRLWFFWFPLISPIPSLQLPLKGL